jgi:hypothetical protein
VPEADHIAHWLPFEWQAGSMTLESRGAAWGSVQVWAISHAEAQRVIEHAAAISGVDLTVKEHRWISGMVRNPRYGRAGVMRVEHTIDGQACISKRVGPSGMPSWMRDPTGVA